jgi:hypothetical protein
MQEDGQQEPVDFEPFRHRRSLVPQIVHKQIHSEAHCADHSRQCFSRYLRKNIPRLVFLPIAGL